MKKLWLSCWANLCRAKLFVERNFRLFSKNSWLSPDKISPNKLDLDIQKYRHLPMSFTDNVIDIFLRRTTFDMVLNVSSLYYKYNYKILLQSCLVHHIWGYIENFYMTGTCVSSHDLISKIIMKRKAKHLCQSFQWGSLKY